MLAIGRALMARPRLLMLDEPSLGLAPLIVREVLHVVSSLRAHGVSVLLVEQNARAALQVADRGYVLETGAVALTGAGAATCCTTGESSTPTWASAARRRCRWHPPDAGRAAPQGRCGAAATPQTSGQNRLQRLLVNVLLLYNL